MNLNDFIKLLKEKNELIEINYPVSPNLEITEIVDRITKTEAYNKALLFKNNGTNFPILINAFGNEKRISYALHANSLTEIENKIDNIFNAFVPSFHLSFFKKIKIAKKLLKISSYLPKFSNKRGSCQEVIYKKPDLNIFPILKCWEFDGGKFITLPMVHTKDPNKGNLNIGMYRMQVFDSNKTGMHWHIHKTGANHFNIAKTKNIKIPIAVTLGGDPVYTYCATAPLPEGINEYILAGILRQKAVNLIPCITQPIYVPEDVDIVIEGYVDTSEPLALEGPFGDHTGFYTLPDYYPVFHITAITHKKNAIYPATIVGIPPKEDYWFIKASERIFLKLLKNTLLQEIVDIQMPSYGVAHNLVVVQIKPNYPKHAHKVAHALWGLGQMMLNKILIITDEPLNNKIYEKIASINSWKDRLLLSYGPMDALEHAGIKPLEGGKLLLDATFINENNNLRINNLKSIINTLFNNIKINDYFAKYNIYLLFASAYDYIDFNKLINILSQENIEQEIRLFIFQKELFDFELHDLAWHFLAFFDPSLDFKIISNNKTDLLIFDGRIKIRNERPIPNPTISPLSVIEKVNKNWNNYFDIPFIHSSSEKYSKLFFGNNYFIEKTFFKSI